MKGRHGDGWVGSTASQMTTCMQPPDMRFLRQALKTEPLNLLILNTPQSEAVALLRAVRERLQAPL